MCRDARRLLVRRRPSRPRCPRSSRRRAWSALDPCALLDGDARGTLGLEPGVPGKDELGANCRWDGQSPQSVQLTAYTSGEGLSDLTKKGDPAASRVRLSGYPALETFTAGRRVLPLRRRRRGRAGDRGDHGRRGARLVHRAAETTHRCPVATSRLEVGAFRPPGELGANPLTVPPGEAGDPRRHRRTDAGTAPITDRGRRPRFLSGRADARRGTGSSIRPQTGSTAQMGDFNFQQYVAPVQDVDANAAGGAGGDGGHSGSLAFGYNDVRRRRRPRRRWRRRWWQRRRR